MKQRKVTSTARTYKLLQPLIPPPIKTSTFKVDDTFFGENAIEVYTDGGNFTEWFKGKIESGACPPQLIAFQLKKDANDEDIINELGDIRTVQVCLVDVWRLIEQQPKGEDGALLANGPWNLFYVEQASSGLVRVVGVVWPKGCRGWFIGAFALNGTSRAAGSRVFRPDF